MRPVQCYTLWCVVFSTPHMQHLRWTWKGGTLKLTLQMKNLKFNNIKWLTQVIQSTVRVFLASILASQSSPPKGPQQWNHSSNHIIALCCLYGLLWGIKIWPFLLQLPSPSFTFTLCFDVGHHSSQYPEQRLGSCPRCFAHLAWSTGKIWLCHSKTWL